MTTLWEIVDDLVDTLDDIAGLHPQHGPTRRLQTPAAVLTVSEGVNPGWGVAVGPITGRIVVLVRFGASGPDGIRGLYDYTSTTGNKSINVALENSHDESGALVGKTVHSIDCLGTEEPEVYEYPDGEVYFGQAIRFTAYP